MPLYVFCALSDHAIYTETEDNVSAHPAVSLENGVDFVHLVCNTSPSQTQKKKKLDEFIMVAKETTDDNKSMGIVQVQGSVAVLRALY